MSFVLAIDQGTTSSRAIVFRSDISIAASAQAEFPQHFPASGWVEHEPEDIWTSTVMVCRDALERAGLTAKDIAAIGITNQRETTVVWDRATGTAVHRAIVWQDRRPRARHRRHQRLAHAAVQHPQRRMGRRTAENPARAALDAAGGEGFLGKVRRQRC